MAEMSSMMVFAIGFASLAGSLSVYATRKITNRQETARPIQKPLVLPWLVSNQELWGPAQRNRNQRPVVSTIQPRKDRRLATTPQGSHRVSRRESLPPYVSPAVAEPAYTGFSSNEKCDFGPGMPLAKLQSLPRFDDVEHLSRLPTSCEKREPHPNQKALASFKSPAQSLTCEESPELEDEPSIEWSHEGSQWRAHQGRSNRSSLSSIASSIGSRARDSYLSCHEFQELGIVIGCGSRVAQAERLDLAHASAPST